MSRSTARTALIAVAGLAFAGAVVALVAAGCDDRPRAPALYTEAVYENPDIGLTFMVPEGWTASARSTAPAETKLERPLQLVRYQAPGDASTALELYAVDLPPGKEVLAYISDGRNQIGSERWALTKPAATEPINGTPGTRFALTEIKKSNRRRDIVAFDRGGGRHYLFLVTYNAGSSARQQAGRAIDTVQWK